MKKIILSVFTLNFAITFAAGAGKWNYDSGLTKGLYENEVTKNQSVIDAAFAPLLQDEAWAQDLLEIEADSDKLLVKPASN